MNAPAFTPGPWHTTKWSRKESDIVAGPPEKRVFVTGHALNADAHLIAAAPAMFEALELADQLYQTGILNDKDGLWERAHAARKSALTLARGEQP